MADAASLMAGSTNHTADASDRMAGSFPGTAGRIIRAAGSPNRTAGRFIRTNQSSSRMVFRQKYAKNGQNRLFSPSRRADRSKSDSLATRAGRARHSVRAAYARSLSNTKGLPRSRRAADCPPCLFASLAYFAVQTSTKNNT
jgi:hypothetical protein